MSDNSAPTKTISDFEAKLNEADKTVASFEDNNLSALQRARGYLRANPTAIPAIILVVSILVFGLIAKNFMSAGTLSLILKQVTVTGIIAIAQTIIILTAGIDLSVGAMLVICAMVAARWATIGAPGLSALFNWLGMEGMAGFFAQPFPFYFVVLLAIVIGTVMGTVNGLLVTKARIPPFIATLGTFFAFNALKLWYTGSESVRAIDLEQTAPGLLWFGNGFEILGAKFIYGSIALLLLAALAWYMLSRTPWGRHVHAVGDDMDAAMLTGIQTERTLVSVYALAGLICGFCGWVAIGRVGSMSPIAFENINLDSITAVVIGGTSLFGGRASIAGSVLGAIIVGVFNTGLSLAGVDSYWQMFASGCLIIVAVAFDQWLRRASQ